MLLTVDNPVPAPRQVTSDECRSCSQFTLRTMDSYLGISKDHLDALDPARVRADAIIGNDNYAKLQVSTVFAAISIESALNNFILMHCLFIENRTCKKCFAQSPKGSCGRPSTKKSACYVKTGRMNSEMTSSRTSKNCFVSEIGSRTNQTTS